MHHSFLTTLLIISLLNPSSQSILNGYSIEDLIATNPTDFQAEAFSWQTSQTLCTNCVKYLQIIPNACYSEPDLILGGPSVFPSGSPDLYSFERFYASLAPHNFIAFTMTFYYFQDYNSNFLQYDSPIVDFIIDNTLMFTGPRLSASDVSCSPTDNLLLAPVIFQGSFDHFSTTLNLKIQSKYPYDQIQIGFRQIVFHLSNYSEPFPDTSICQILPTSGAYSDQCPCEVGETVTSSGSCEACSENCQSCFGANPNQCNHCESGAYWHGQSCSFCAPYCQECSGRACLSCVPNAYRYPNGACLPSCPVDSPEYSTLILQGQLYCLSNCPESSNYRYANGVCSSSCPSPLLPYEDSRIKACVSPCLFPGERLYPDGSCFIYCQAPFIDVEISGVQYCRTPCLDSQFYVVSDDLCLDSCEFPLRNSTELGALFCTNLCSVRHIGYSNGSCLSSCPAPFKLRYETIGRFCDKPCPEGEYLDWNGSCINNCPSRFIINIDVDNIQHCANPCQSNPQGYIYSNSTCSSKCNFPFKQRVQENIFYCDFLCPEGSNFYYPEDGSCQKLCEYPYQSIENICTLMLTESQAKQAEKIAETTDVTNSLTSGGIVIGSIIASGDSTSATMGPLTKMLSYIKFMNIKFPPKVQQMFYAQSSANSSFFGAPEKLQSEASNKPAPYNFRKYHMSPNFLVNFWQSLIIIGAILSVILVSTISLSFLKGFSKVTQIIKKILSALRWNLFFTLFCSMTGDIVLFSGLEFQTLNLENFISTLSFFLSIAMIILMLFTLYQILTINSAVRAKTSHNSSNFEEYKTLYECYKEDSYCQQIFLFIFIIRVSVFNGVIVYLHSSPLIQAIIIVLLNGGILAYLLIKRPMRKIINFIQQVAIEGSLFVFNLCVFILAVLDAQKNKDWSTRENLGNVIIAINMTTPILSTAIIVIKISLIAKDFYVDYKISKKTAVKKLDHLNIQQPRDLSSIQGEIETKNPSSEIHQIQTLNQTDLQLLPTNNNSFFIESSDYSSNLQPISSPDNFEINSLTISQTDETLINPTMTNSALIRKKPRHWWPRKLTNNLPSEPNLDKTSV